MNPCCLFISNPRCSSFSNLLQSALPERAEVERLYGRLCPLVTDYDRRKLGELCYELRDRRSAVLASWFKRRYGKSLTKLVTLRTAEPFRLALLAWLDIERDCGKLEQHYDKSSGGYRAKRHYKLDERGAKDSARSLLALLSSVSVTCDYKKLVEQLLKPNPKQLLALCQEYLRAHGTTLHASLEAQRRGGKWRGSSGLLLEALIAHLPDEGKVEPLPYQALCEALRRGLQTYGDAKGTRIEVRREGARAAVAALASVAGYELSALDDSYQLLFKTQLTLEISEHVGGPLHHLMMSLAEGKKSNIERDERAKPPHDRPEEGGVALLGPLDVVDGRTKEVLQRGWAQHAELRPKELRDLSWESAAEQMASTLHAATAQSASTDFFGLNSLLCKASRAQLSAACQAYATLYCRPFEDELLVDHGLGDLHSNWLVGALALLPPKGQLLPLPFSTESSVVFDALRGRTSKKAIFSTLRRMSYTQAQSFAVNHAVRYGEGLAMAIKRACAGGYQALCLSMLQVKNTS